MQYAEIDWLDGQPHSKQYSDLYYSSSGGLAESEYVFIRQNNLIERFKCSAHFIVAEAGFGTGLNFVATCRQWLEHAPADAVLHYVGIEKHPVSPDDIRRVSAGWAELEIYYDELLSHYPSAMPGSHQLVLFDGRVRLTLDFLDIGTALNGRRFKADAWFLDGFDPKSNQYMWDDNLVNKISVHSKKGSTVSTYTAAGHVRRRLVEAGFEVVKVKGHAKKREMITATYDGVDRYTSTSPWYDIPDLPQEYSVKTKTAVVVGAGLAGLTSAMALVNQGWKVTLIDQHEKVAQEASGNPAGILLPRISLGNDDEEQFYVNAYLFAKRQLTALQGQTAMTFWHVTGVLSEETKDKANKILNRYVHNDDFVRRATSEIPFQFKADCEVIDYPSAGWVNTSALCLSLYKKIKDNISYINSKVDSLERVNSSWNINNKKGTIASAPVVILATGTSITDIDITSWLPVSAIRGQMTELEANIESVKLKQCISFGRFFTPAYKGKHHTGASYDLDDKSYNLSRNNQDENIKQLNKVLPGLYDKREQLTGRAGFRAVSEDRMPIVGPVPDVDWFLQNYRDLSFGRPVNRYQAGRYHEGLYVNTAHGSRGLTTSFLSAELLVALIQSSPQPCSSSITNALNPARFIIRRLKRNQIKNR